jgi:hypothetical protein
MLSQWVRKNKRSIDIAFAVLVVAAWTLGAYWAFSVVLAQN